MPKIQPKSLIEKLNPYCREAMENATGLCLGRSHYEVTVDHVLLKLVDHPQADVQNILRHFEIDPARVIGALQHNVESLRAGNTGKPVFSPLLFEWMKEAWISGSLELGEMSLRSGLLLLALLEAPSRYLVAGEVLELNPVDSDVLRKQFADITSASLETKQAPRTATGASGREGAPAAGEGALGRFCIDVTAAAKAGNIDAVFGRDREIRQMVDILARRRKNNPIVVGEPGVGKTAVVEGLALRIAQNDVPDILANVILLTLDLGLLQAGAGVKGEFENRLKQVIAEVKASPRPIILFIDEAHTLIGAGGQAGGGDAANLLKPALARGELRTIAATTWSEYKKYFEKDPALARRFQPVKLEEPSVEDTIVMLRGLREKYEAAHGVQIPDSALVAAAEMSGRYISGRLLPDKAVDLVDTAAARVKIALTTRPDTLEDNDRRIQMLVRERDTIRRDLRGQGEPDNDRIVELDAEIKKLEVDLKDGTARWQTEKQAVENYLKSRAEIMGAGNGSPDQAALKLAITALASAQGATPMIPVDVSQDIVGKVVADWTGIPVGKMVKDQASSVLALEDRLKERIKGQDHAMTEIAKGIRASKAGLQDPTKPIGVFLLVGPSGVGKTETALGIADLLFGGERFMTTINMSEHQESHTVSKLKGSPAGYVGYGEGGVLTEAVRQRPYSVVLLDEIEKAHIDVMNLFYQVFDKAKLEDGEGREIDFKNTVIFLTSNLGTNAIMQAASRDPRPSKDDLAQAILPELYARLAPALVGRMTVIPYYPLNEAAMTNIVRLKLNKVARRLQESHKMALTYDDAVIGQIAARCTEVETGARNIDHIISGTLLPNISTEILQRLTAGPLPDKLHVGIDGGEFALEFS